MATNLLERYTSNPPDTSKANLKGKDKTPISADGGSNLLENLDLIKQTNARPLGNGAGGYSNTSGYSDFITSKKNY